MDSGNKFLLCAVCFTIILTSYFMGVEIGKQRQDYYVFNPSWIDSCENLQHKLNLFHPNGTNPIIFDLIDMMKNKNCEIIRK